MGELQEFLDELMGKKWKIAIMIICAIIIIYIIYALIFNIWPFSILKKVVNENAMIQNYEWFYDQYNKIESQKANISIMDKDAEELPGMKMVLNNAIAEYNSRSKQITRNLWKAPDLPYQIKIEGVER